MSEKPTTAAGSPDVNSSGSAPQEKAKESSQKAQRFSRLTMFTLVLGGLAIVALIAYFLFGVDIHSGKLAAVATLGVLGLLVIGQFIRYRERISLRTLMIIVSVLAIGLAYVGRRIAQSRAEHEAVQQLVDLGVTATYAADVEGAEEYFVTEGGWYLPMWLHDWFGAGFFSDLRELDFTNSRVEDRHLALLSEIHSLETLTLRSSQITATGIAKMPIVPGVHHLDLDARQLSPASIARIAELRDLKNVSVLWPFNVGAANAPAPMINLEGLSQLSDLEELVFINFPPAAAQEGTMTALAELRSLRTLQIVYGAFAAPTPQKNAYAALSKSNSIRQLTIARTPFGDPELAMVQQIDSLNSLMLSGTAITQNGVTAFRVARPNVKLMTNPPFPQQQNSPQNNAAPPVGSTPSGANK